MSKEMAIASAVQSVNAGKDKEAAYKRDADRETFAAKPRSIASRRLR